MSGGGRNPISLVPAMLAALALRASGLVSPAGREKENRRDADGPPYETRDVNVRNTVLVMGGLALSAAAVIGGMVLFLRITTERQRAALPSLTPQQTTRLVPPPPNLQPNPYVDLDRERAQARAALDGYGYLDPARTRARIPLDRAMQVVVGRSLDGGSAAP